MQPTTSRKLAFLFTLLLCSALAHAQQIKVTPDHADGVYDVGQAITFKIDATGAAQAPESITYSLKKFGRTEVGKGTVMLKDGVGIVETKLDEPATMLLEVRTGAGRFGRSLAGAVAGPRKIMPIVPLPADFDAFWAEKVKELHAVPANPQLEEADGAKNGVDYRKITMDNIRGTHIHGQLARPKEGDKLPALLVVQWAGVYPLQKSWVTSRAAEGWLVLNIEAHDLPIDESPQFYQQQNSGALQNYAAIGNDDRETSYFLRMYLSCYRAADYLAQRPEWDGKTLVVSGTSQGGQQTLMLAGFHPKITAALALVPAGSDMRGPDAGRAPGWPQWYFATRGKDADKVHKASEYFDVVNFASHITCPTLVGFGLIDETSTPSSVLTSINQIKGPVELVIAPNGAHQDGPEHSQARYVARANEWLAQLRQGKTPGQGIAPSGK